jgi:hypothetical protein
LTRSSPAAGLLGAVDPLVQRQRPLEEIARLVDLAARVLHDCNVVEHGGALAIAQFGVALEDLQRLGEMFDGARLHPGGAHVDAGADQELSGALVALRQPSTWLSAASECGSRRPDSGCTSPESPLRGYTASTNRSASPAQRARSSGERTIARHELDQAVERERGIAELDQRVAAQRGDAAVELDFVAEGRQAVVAHCASPARSSASGMSSGAR